jgi:pepF/M3 family oligoendopeptidase
MTTATPSMPPSASTAAPRWDLDSAFPGGSGSKELQSYRDQLRADLKALKQSIAAVPSLSAATIPQWEECILKLQSVGERLEYFMSFSNCLISQNVGDAPGHVLVSDGDALNGEFTEILAAYDGLVREQDQKSWDSLLEQPSLAVGKFTLNERRRFSRMKMSTDKEILAASMSVNGYHAWNRLYDKMAGELSAEFVENGVTTKLSLGQLASKMGSDDRATRKQAFDKMTACWKSRADLAAMTLNSLAGYRLSLYQARGWESPLTESLFMAKMEQSSIDAMWGTIKKNLHRLAPYIDGKKRMLGIDKFSWWDEFAPAGSGSAKINFEEAGDFISRQFGTLSKGMADFANHALAKRWVEGEDRSGKAGGAYCTNFGPLKETRVFMTYADTFDNLLTLAHELGHAYHGWVVKDMPWLATQYPMTLAETASIFAETLVNDAALSETREPGARLFLLDQKLQGALVMFTNLHARYIFERAFYERRRTGTLTADELCTLMTNAQEEAYGSLLDPSGRHPYFWCSKLHFYISDTPFYNFPYVVGFLFAQGVYARAKKEGKSFESRYDALLSDTGIMTTEAVAKKHLGADLSDDSFWQSAIDEVLGSVPEFVALTK